MNKVLLFIILIMSVKESFAQDSSLYIKSWTNPKKVYQVKLQSGIKLHFSMYSDSLKLRTISIVTGRLESVSDSFLVMYLSTENVTLNYDKGGHSMTIYNTYNWRPDEHEELLEGDRRILSSGTALQKVKLSSIWYFTYTRGFNSQSGEINTQFGGVLMTAAATMLFFAPWVSINYKTGGFNHARFDNWSTIGLIGAGASIPFFTLGALLKKKEGHKFYLSKSPDEKSKELYFLTNKK